jgi:hypothetical protein
MSVDAEQELIKMLCLAGMKTQLCVVLFSSCWSITCLSLATTHDASQNNAGMTFHAMHKAEETILFPQSLHLISSGKQSRISLQLKNCAQQFSSSAHSLKSKFGHVLLNLDNFLFSPQPDVVISGMNLDTLSVFCFFWCVEFCDFCRIHYNVHHF